MTIKKTTSLNRIIQQDFPECQHFKDLWNSTGCLDKDWIKRPEWVKNRDCSRIFRGYMECVLYHSSQ